MKERWKQVVRPSARLVQDWSRKKETFTRDTGATGMNWTRGIVLAAAFAVIMLAFVFAWMKPMRAKPSLSDYRDEMVSFAKLDPALEMQSSELPTLTSWLQETHKMSGIAVPDKLRSMQPVGCRVLRFRGHDVGLICFRQTNGKLLHLFVIDRSAFPELAGREHPDITTAPSGWATAAWDEGDHAYLLAIEGDSQSAQQMLGL
jgi:hypothetical protein